MICSFQITAIYDLVEAHEYRTSRRNNPHEPVERIPGDDEVRCFLAIYYEGLVVIGRDNDIDHADVFNSLPQSKVTFKKPARIINAYAFVFPHVSGGLLMLDREVDLTQEEVNATAEQGFVYMNTDYQYASSIDSSEPIYTDSAITRFMQKAREDILKPLD